MLEGTAAHWIRCQISYRKTWKLIGIQKKRGKIRGREKLEQVDKIRRCDRRLRRIQWILKTG